MKLLFVSVLIVISQYYCFGQQKADFRVTEIFADSSHKKTLLDFQKANSNFFEDEKYVIRKTCSGEWGGSIWFKNKKTGVERSCSATCPVIVNKVGDKYIVTTTLNHLSGSSQIIEIENPEKLTVFKLPKPRKVNGSLTRYVGDDETRSTIGSKSLLDTFRLSVLISFPIKGKLYHIITDYKRTYIATIENKHFITVAILSHQSFWTYSSEIIKAFDNHLVAFFKNDKAEGYIDIYNDQINVVRYR